MLVSDYNCGKVASRIHNPNPNLMYPRDKYLYRHTNINNREQVEGFLYLLSKQILGADNHYYWRYVSKNEMMVFL